MINYETIEKWMNDIYREVLKINHLGRVMVTSLLNWYDVVNIILMKKIITIKQWNQQKHKDGKKKNYIHKWFIDHSTVNRSHWYDHLFKKKKKTWTSNE